MKKILFTLLAIFVCGQMLYSQSEGKVVYGPKANSSDQALSIANPAGGMAVVYDEATWKGSGFTPIPAGSGESDAPAGDQFTAYVSSSTATSFTVTVVDAGDCAGVYTVSCSPIAGSGPGGTTPPNTNISAYIGFPQGSFFFGNAGEGEYAITVTNTNNACSPPTNPVQFKAWPSTYTPTYVPVTAEVINIIAPSIPWNWGGYTNDGRFTMHVSETGSCVGTYTISAQPVPNSAPDGSTPPQTTIIMYIGFPAGNFLFDHAGTGSYHVTVTQTDPFTICNYTDNPREFTVVIPDTRPIPISNWALVLGIGLIAMVVVIRFRRSV